MLNLLVWNEKTYAAKCLIEIFILILNKYYLEKSWLGTYSIVPIQEIKMWVSVP